MKSVQLNRLASPEALSLEYPDWLARTQILHIYYTRIWYIWASRRHFHIRHTMDVGDHNKNFYLNENEAVEDYVKVSMERQRKHVVFHRMHHLLVAMILGDFIRTYHAFRMGIPELGILAGVSILVEIALFLLFKYHSNRLEPEKVRPRTRRACLYTCVLCMTKDIF